MPTIIKGQPTSAEVRAQLAAEGRPVLVAFDVEVARVRLTQQAFIST